MKTLSIFRLPSKRLNTSFYLAKVSEKPKMVFSLIKILVHHFWSFVTSVLRVALLFAAMHAFGVAHLCFVVSHEKDLHQIFWKTFFWKTFVFDAFAYVLLRTFALAIAYGKVHCKSLNTYLSFNIDNHYLSCFDLQLYRRQNRLNGQIRSQT